MDTNAFHLWIAQAMSWVFIGGFIAYVFGLTVERLCDRYDWPTVKRCLPAMVMAVLLAVWFAADHRSAHPVFTPFNKSVGYEPFCADIFYYVNVFCWSQP